MKKPYGSMSCFRRVLMRDLSHLEQFKIDCPEMQELMDKDFIAAYLLKLGDSSLDFLVLVSVHDNEW